MTNELSLAPRDKKISDNFGRLEAMIIASITEIERMKVLAEESNADEIKNMLGNVEEDPDEDLLESKAVDVESIAVEVADDLQLMTILDNVSE